MWILDEHLKYFRTRWVKESRKVSSIFGAVTRTTKRDGALDESVGSGAEISRVPYGIMRQIRSINFEIGIDLVDMFLVLCIM